MKYLIFTIVLVIGLMIVVILQEKHISDLERSSAEYKEAELDCIKEIYSNMHKLEKEIRILRQDLYLLQNGYDEGDDE